MRIDLRCERTGEPCPNAQQMREIAIPLIELKLAIQDDGIPVKDEGRVACEGLKKTFLDQPSAAGHLSQYIGMSCTAAVRPPTFSLPDPELPEMFFPEDGKEGGNVVSIRRARKFGQPLSEQGLLVRFEDSSRDPA